VFEELNKAGIETEMILVGKNKIRGCMACYTCLKVQNEKCVFDDDPINSVNSTDSIQARNLNRAQFAD
jgi:multimeric flavodoxin WrbA